MKQDHVVCVMARAPVPGNCKTRLEPGYGKAGAARISRELARLSVTTACQAASSVVQLWCAPDSRHGFFTSMRREYGVELKTQTGADLGERMAGVVRHNLVQFDKVLLTGTDCPFITPQYLRAAIELLDKGHDAILGPANDGGYVMLGLKRFHARLFAGIPWGGNRVLALTHQRLHSCGYNFAMMPGLSDIDTPDDVRYWRSQTGK